MRKTLEVPSGYKPVEHWLRDEIEKQLPNADVLVFYTDSRDYYLVHIIHKTQSLGIKISCSGVAIGRVKDKGKNRQYLAKNLIHNFEASWFEEQE